MKLFRLSAIATTCVTALLASTAAQAESPTVYGVLDYSLTFSSTGNGTQDRDQDQDAWLLENNFSRLGLRGSETINDDLSFFYRAEVGFNADDGKDTFSSRPSYIGLKHKVAGAIAFGRIDTVLKMTKGGADIFGLTNMTMDRVFAGNKRHGDSFEYRSAPWNNIQLAASVVLKDDANSPHDENYQLALSYGDKKFSKSNLYLAAAYGDGIENIKAVRAVAQYKLNNLKLGLMMQDTEALEGFGGQYEDRDGFGYVANAVYQLNDWKLKAQFAQDDSGTGKVANQVYKGGAVLGNDTPELTQWAIGAEYKMSKQLTMHTELGQYKFDDYSDYEDDIVSVGLKFQF